MKSRFMGSFSKGATDEVGDIMIGKYDSNSHDDE